MSTHKALAVGFGLVFMGIAGSASAAQDMPPPPPASSAPLQSAEPSQNKPPVPPPTEAAAPRRDTTKGTLQAKPTVPATGGGTPGGITKGEIRTQNGKTTQPPAPIMHLDPSAAPKPDARPHSIKPAQ